MDAGGWRHFVVTEGMTVKHILVYVGLDRVGDGLLKLPFVRGLRKAFPDAHITWLAGKETSVYAGVLAGPVEGLIDRVIEHGGIGLSPAELLKRPDIRPVGADRFDLIIDTQKIVWTSLSLWRIPHKTFISPAARFALSSVKPKKGYRFPKSMQRQMLDLLELASGEDVPTPTPPLLVPSPELRVAALVMLPAGGYFIGFAPGSGGKPKCWPLENFIALAQNQEYRVPVFFLGPQEEHWKDQIKAQVPSAIFPLQQKNFGFDPLFTIALAERMKVSVANDSGVGHMLALGGKPLVSLYGPTVPEKFMPMGDRVTVFEAKDYGGQDIALIPRDVVGRAMETILQADPSPTLAG